MATIPYLHQLNGKNILAERATYTREGRNIDSALAAASSNTIRLITGPGIAFTPGASGLTISSTVPQGPTGPTGPCGPMGATGATGLKGTDGSRGNTGLQGGGGATGATGSQGATGTTGNTGSQGATGAGGGSGGGGSQGSAGVGGSVGARGKTGLQGDTGNTGSGGAKGKTGAIGATGATGARGPTGPKGYPTSVAVSQTWTNATTPSFTPTTSYVTVHSIPKDSYGRILEVFFYTTATSPFYLSVRVRDTTNNITEIEMPLAIQASVFEPYVYMLCTPNTAYSVDVKKISGTATTVYCRVLGCTLGA